MTTSADRRAHAAYMKAYYWKTRDRWLARLDPASADRRKNLRDLRANGRFFCGVGHGENARVYIAPDGHRACRDCRVERTQRWREQNPMTSVQAEAAHVRGVAYYRDHADVIKARVRQYAAENAESVAAAKRRWVEAHRERCRASARNGKAHRRVRIAAACVESVEPYWPAIVVKHNGRCAYCGASGVLLERDHVKALANGGQHSVANVVPACRSCNRRKGTKTWIPSSWIPANCEAA